MTFWIIAIAAALIAAFIAVRPLLGRRSSAAPRAAHDAQVFRDQLKELDREVARGVVTAEDAEETRIEISRRLLAADAESRKAQGAGAAPAALSRAAAAVLIIAAPLAAAWLYTDLGAPGAKDSPLASRSEDQRPSQAEAEQMMAGRAPAAPAGADAAEFERLVEQLEARLEATPNDQQGIFLYARSLMNLARFDEAWPQFEKLIALRGATADAELYSGYAEAMILAAGGYVSPEAEAAILQVLKRDPVNPSARYYLGFLAMQENAPQRAEAIWGQLLAESPPGAPWVEPIRAQMASLGLGQRDTEGLPGPTREDMEAASSLPPADRQAMVADMVASLEERLMSEGGSVAEWRRLIRSYSTLGRNADAQEALKKAEAAFANDPAALAALRAGDAAPSRGPSREDVEAASDLSPEDRQQMIQGMISQLHERLQEEGKTADVNEWGKLMRSYRIVDDTEAIRKAYEEAAAIFSDDAMSLAYLKEAALLNGVEFE